MQKIKTFLRTYSKSLTEPSYYNHVLKAKFSFSLKYFLFFYFLLSCLTATVFNFRTKPQLHQLFQNAIHEITTNYPDQLELTFDQNQLQVTGVDQPYHIPFPTFITNESLSSYYDHFITLDTTSDFPRTKSFLTLTQNDIFFRRPDDRKESFPLSDLELDGLTVNKHVVQLTTSSLQSALDTLIKHSPLLIFVGTLISYPLVSLTTLLFYSLFIWLTGNILNKNLPYKKSYQLGLHLITFAETVIVVQDLLFPNLVFTQLFSLAFFGAALIAIYPLQSLKSK